MSVAPGSDFADDSMLTSLMAAESEPRHRYGRFGPGLIEAQVHDRCPHAQVPDFGMIPIRPAGADLTVMVLGLGIDVDAERRRAAWA